MKESHPVAQNRAQNKVNWQSRFGVAVSVKPKLGGEPAISGRGRGKPEAELPKKLKAAPYRGFGTKGIGSLARSWQRPSKRGCSSRRSSGHCHSWVLLKE